MSICGYAGYVILCYSIAATHKCLIFKSLYLLLLLLFALSPVMIWVSAHLMNGLCAVSQLTKVMSPDCSTNVILWNL